jgi:hypothetical protein
MDAIREYARLTPEALWGRTGPAPDGCHGGTGITFIRGYNAAYQVLDELG